MRLTVLVDNNASMNLRGEWGLSFFIESEGQNILFDLGGSDLFIHNAASLGIDLFGLDYLVLSHGHYDHTWGLDYLIKQRLGERRRVQKTLSLVAHPEVLGAKFRDDSSEFGVLAAKSLIARHFQAMYSRQPIRLTEKLIFLGEIERVFEFENHSLGKVYDSQGELVADRLLDDTALVYQAAAGLVIITGCSHSGICNIVEYARKVCRENRVVDIIGGFHLLKLPPENIQLTETLSYLRRLDPLLVHPCHCTDLQAKIALAAVCPVEEVRAGTVIEYEY